MSSTFVAETITVPEAFARGMSEPQPESGSGGRGFGALDGYDGDRGGHGDDARRKFERLVALVALAAAGAIMTTALIVERRSLRSRV